MLQVGQDAPDFTLPDQSGSEVSLKELRGSWVVLWWYPKASSGSCTAEGQTFSEYGEQFEAEGAQIVGISFDDQADNCAFADEEAFTFPLLSDTTREVGREYGVVRPEGADFDHLPHRYTYLIDPEGVVRANYDVGMDVVSSRQHPPKVLEDLKALVSADE